MASPHPDQARSSKDQTSPASGCNYPSPLGEQTSTCDLHISALPPNPDKPPARRKEPMKEFVWGGGLIRKTLPRRVIPRWLDPLYVDVDDPTKLPLCWFGVPFLRKLVYNYAESIGLASYYTREVLCSKPGDLDTFQTWANLEVWFQKESGLKLDLNLVWGEPTPILTFWSNHEILHIAKEQWGLVCDLLDDIGYGEEYELMWYLDRDLDVRLLLPSLNE
ncbi:hypothetical protein LXA43DRAFT_951054 [Ganoderma leucocontextum]|nr:hypothetical protein LXA43DRAFT_951054 [Ganoderma leucocontextum]